MGNDDDDRRIYDTTTADAATINHIDRHTDPGVEGLETFDSIELEYLAWLLARAKM